MDIFQKRQKLYSKQTLQEMVRSAMLSTFLYFSAV